MGDGRIARLFIRRFHKTVTEDLKGVPQLGSRGRLEVEGDGGVISQKVHGCVFQIGTGGYSFCFG